MKRQYTIQTNELQRKQFQGKFLEVYSEQELLMENVSLCLDVIALNCHSLYRTFYKST